MHLLILSSTSPRYLHLLVFFSEILYKGYLVLRLVALLNIFIFTAMVFTEVGARTAILWSLPLQALANYCFNPVDNHGISCHITTQQTLEQVVANIYQLNFSLMYKFLENTSSWISLPSFEVCILILLHFSFFLYFYNKLLAKLRLALIFPCLSCVCGPLCSPPRLMLPSEDSPRVSVFWQTLGHCCHRCHHHLGAGAEPEGSLGSVPGVEGLVDSILQNSAEVGSPTWV